MKTVSICRASAFWFRGAGKAVLVLAVASLAAACGGSSASPGVASLGTSTSTTSALGSASSNGDSNLQQAYQAQLAYSQCMRTHGEPTFPDPTRTSHSISVGAGRNIDQHSHQFVSASTTCKRLVPDGGPPSPAQIQAAIAHTLKNAECMRTHGITNFPDPIIFGGGMGISLKGLDGNRAAVPGGPETCQKLAPLGGIG